MRSLVSLPVLRRLAVAGIAALAGISLLVAVPSLQSVLDELNEADPDWIAIAAALEVASCLSFVGAEVGELRMFTPGLSPSLEAAVPVAVRLVLEECTTIPAGGSG